MNMFKLNTRKKETEIFIIITQNHRIKSRFHFFYILRSYEKKIYKKIYIFRQRLEKHH